MTYPKTKSKVFWFFTLSVSLVAGFFVMLGLETQGASTTDQVQLSVAVQTTIALDCGSDVNLGSLTPGTPVTGSSTCTATTNSASGYNLKVKKDNAGTTMNDGGGHDISDKTAWNSSSPNGAIYSGTGLAFRVKTTGTTSNYNSTWWGSDDTDSNAKFAGFPSSYDTIMNYSSYSGTSTDTIVGYKLDVPTTQPSGSYSGTITFQANTNP